LYRNKHDGTFEEIGLLSGTALNDDGRMQASMGVDIADYAHAGHPAILVTNFSQEGADFFVNRGEPGFEQSAATAGLLDATFPYVGWGAVFFDFDNDGWLDVMIANGHAYPQMESVKDGVPYREPLLLFRNTRNGKFQDVTTDSGLNKLPLHSRRGLAFGDVNNDGKLDVLLLNVGEPPTLLINRTETPNHAAMFRLIGTKSNRAAIGAKITVTAGDLVESGEVRAGSSYLSQNDLRLHFGLDSQTRIDKVEIFWPSGLKEQYRNLSADSIYTLVESQGIRDKTPFVKTPGSR
jgi:hypothetical protein